MPSEKYGGLHSQLTLMAIALSFLLLASIYLRGWCNLRSTLPKSGGLWRFAGFAIGVLLTWSVLATPFGHLDQRSLTAHMAQHLVLMTLAAPLLLLGEPVITLVRSLPSRYCLRVAKWLSHFAPVRGRISVYPVFCWLIGTVCVIWWHVPTVFAFGMRSERWHEFEQLTFFAAGLVFWWPVVQPWPSSGRRPGWFIPLYLFLATLPCDALSAFLTFCDRVVYSTCVARPELYHGSALGDQEFAGSMMWVWVTFVYLIPAVVITVQRLYARKPSWEQEVVPVTTLLDKTLSLEPRFPGQLAGQLCVNQNQAVAERD